MYLFKILFRMAKQILMVTITIVTSERDARRVPVQFLRRRGLSVCVRVLLLVHATPECARAEG